MKLFKEYSESTEEIDFIQITQETETMALTVIGETFKGNGTPTDKSGAAAEELVLETILNCFPDNTGYVYVNKRLPQFPVEPDFIIPALSKDQKKLRLFVIECKADKIIKRDGSGRKSDPYTQLKKYREAIEKCFSFYSKKVEIECLAIFPNTEIPFTDLVNDGRSGVYWGSLDILKSKLRDLQPVPHHHDLLSELNRIYDRRKIISDKRIEIADRDIIKKTKDFGGINGYKGVAGSGKTFLLAHQITKDALEESRELIYLTHNKNLVDVFIKHVETISGLKHQEEIYPMGGPQQKVKFIAFPNLSRIYFCNIDAFPTRFFTMGLDRLDGFSSHGPLYEICKRNGIGSDDDRNSRVTEDNYSNCREELLNKLKENIFSIRQNHILFDGLYFDEFQDCKNDRTRLDIAVPFIRCNDKNEPNIFFAEDPLQSYLRWDACKDLNHAQQEEDEESSTIPKNSKDVVKTYTALFGKKVYPRELTSIYRTPKNIFKAAFNLIKDGFRKGQFDKFIEKLEFKGLPAGKLERLSSNSAYSKLLEMKKLPAKSTSLISHIEDKFKVSADHHHLQCRGCEWDNVFIYSHKLFLENPNYLYTLMCRTKDYLAIVESDSCSNEVDEIFKRFSS